MDLLKQSRRWHDEATELIESSDIKDLLGRFGDVLLTGSYEYDLMLGADIDFFVCNDKPTRELAEDIAVALTRGGYWNSIMFCDWMALPTFKQQDHPELPAGHYFCVKREHKGNRWKIDIFLVDPKELQERLATRNMYSHVSGEQKQTILQLKEARNSGHLASDISSTVFYDAVISNGVASVEEFMKSSSNT